jgi:hypothetical protein
MDGKELLKRSTSYRLVYPENNDVTGNESLECWPTPEQAARIRESFQLAEQVLRDIEGEDDAVHDGSDCDAPVPVSVEYQLPRAGDASAAAARRPESSDDEEIPSLPDPDRDPDANPDPDALAALHGAAPGMQYDLDSFLFQHQLINYMSRRRPLRPRQEERVRSHRPRRHPQPDLVDAGKDDGKPDVLGFHARFFIDKTQSRAIIKFNPPMCVLLIAVLFLVEY